MQKQSLANPFTPRFGKVPAYLAGREDVIDELTSAFEQGDGDPSLCSIFVGARGTGKTALLSSLASRAEESGWISANVIAGVGMLDDILQRLSEAAAHLIDTEQGKKLTGVPIGNIGGVTWENTGAQGNWRTRMNALFAQLDGKNVGVLITVDEVDCSEDEVVRLVTTYQHFVREGRKCALLMAGLPHKVSALLSGESTSFLRRAVRHNLGLIASYEVEEAFRLTVEFGGKSIGDEALAAAVKAIDGFPYMFQLVGFRAWRAADLNDEITVEHIEQGTKIAQEELESRVFDATWAELSKNDIAFLEAMAREGVPVSRQELVDRLGKGTSHVSTYKKRLLDAGVIEERRRGYFDFALPGFGDYVAKRM